MREILEYQVGQSELGFLGFVSEPTQMPGQPHNQKEPTSSGSGKKLWIEHRPVAGFAGGHLSAIDEACLKLQQTQDFEVARTILKNAGIAATYKKTP